MSKLFVYRVKDADGRQSAGVIPAEEAKLAAAFLRDQGYYVTYLREKGSGRDGLWRRVTQRMTPARELALLCRQMAIMLEAGLSLNTCLQVLGQADENRRMAEAMKAVLRHVRAGESFSGSLQRLPHVFPVLMVNMVTVGENSGALTAVLQRLAVQYEKEHRLGERMKSALAYPAVTAIASVFCVIFLLAVVLPTFEQILQGTGAALPALTRSLIVLGNWIRGHGAELLGSALAVFAGATYFWRRPNVQNQMEDLLLMLPVLGKFRRKLLLVRFSWSLATMLQGGLPLLKALEISQSLITAPSMVKALKALREGVRAGAGLAEPMKRSGAFTGMMVQLIAVGEETGSLVKVLNQIAGYYEEEIEEFSSRAASLTEPVMVCLLGIFIGLIMLAVLMPLLDIISFFSGGGG